MTKKPLVIYHSHCTDGFGAAFAFWWKYADTFEYVAANYNDKDVPDYQGRDVYLVDFSYRRAVVEEMLKAATSVTLLDHHVTAIADLTGLEGLKMDNCTIDKSGAVIAWEFVHGDKPMPWFFKYLQDRDLWLFEFEETKAVTAYLDLFEKEFTAWAIFNSYEADFAGIVKTGRLMVEGRSRSVDAAISKCLRTLPGTDIPLVNITNGLTSEVGNRLSMVHPYSMSYFDTENARIFSLRSNSDNPEHVDVSKIAKGYGGGGHKHAAGFSVSRDHPLAKV